MKKGVEKTEGLRVPVLPRKVKEEIRITPSELQEIQARNPIMPIDRKDTQTREKTIKILKPDLTKEQYFNSNHTTPNESLVLDK